MTVQDIHTCLLCVRFLREADWVVVMEGGRVDQTHSGPPDTVLPWLEQQHTTPHHVVLGAGREEGGSGEEGEIGEGGEEGENGEEGEEGENGEEGEEGENGEEGEDERLLDSTLDVCGPDLTACPYYYYCSR